MWQVVGHQAVVSLLERSLHDGRLAHAYLMVGPPRVGKMTLALELAKAVNCASSQPPCGQCHSCRRIARGIHADVEVVGVLEAEEAGERVRVEISIDQVRELQHRSSLQPYEGHCRVFIFDRAEHMSREAANALLKTLEEPAEGVLLLLLACDPQATLPTIASRCQVLELRPLPEEALTRELVRRGDIGEEHAQELVRLSRGCPGWAIAALSDAELLEGRRSRIEHIARLLEAGREERFAYAAEMASAFGRRREEVRDDLALWQDWLRDLLLVKLEVPDSILNLSVRETLERQARGLSLEQILAGLWALADIAMRLEENANPRLALEVLMLSLPYLTLHTR